MKKMGIAYAPDRVEKTRKWHFWKKWSFDPDFQWISVAISHEKKTEKNNEKRVKNGEK